MKTSQNANLAYRQILKDILDNGTEIEAKKSKSTGSNKITKDLWNYSIRVENQSDYLVQSDINVVAIPLAVSRFIWMMGANNRIKDIEFYWGKGVVRFSDDEIVMPGSNYGARMITPRPGMNQIEGIIERLKKNPFTRRAAISIYHPEDAVRESTDIPCAFGIFYSIRENRLNTTVLMRSNNAKFLFPYNIFEFSLLSEVIAREVGVDLGCLHFQSVSMHLYENDFEVARQIVEEMKYETYKYDNPIPTTSKCLPQIKKLIKLEADLRHASMGISEENLDSWIEQGKSELDSYWVQFYNIILLFIAEKKLLDSNLSLKIYNELNDIWKQYIAEPKIKEVRQASTQSLFEESKSNIIGIEKSNIQNVNHNLEQSCLEVNKGLQNDNKPIISLREYIEIKKQLINTEALAARDGQMFTKEDVYDTLSNLRSEDSG